MRGGGGSRNFGGVDAARVRYLSVDEATETAQRMRPRHSGQLVRGALETGMRYSELARLGGGGTSTVTQAPSMCANQNQAGGRHVVLTDEGARLRQSILDGTSQV